MPLQNVEPQRLYRKMPELPRSLITAGEWVASARLSAERDLTRQLGINRPSTREALITVEIEGWVEVRQGSGVYMLGRTRQANRIPACTAACLSPDEWGPLELIRAPGDVDGKLTAIGATQARRTHLGVMSKAIASLQADADTGVLPPEGDHAIHSTLVESCRHVVRIKTVQRFWDARRGPLLDRLERPFESVDSRRAAIAGHKAIFNGYRQPRPLSARLSMRAHRDNSHNRFSVSWRRTQNHCT